MSEQRIYLVPGFFGFANLGDLKYFGHVHHLLEGMVGGGHVHVVRTRPTASLLHRATRLLETIEATAGPADDLHIIGHSSGGLDARLLVSPGVDLDRPGHEAVAQRVRSVVTVSTPHRGTPAATFFATPGGRGLLRVLSLMTIVALRRGKVPVQAAVLVGRALARSDAQRGMVDEVFADLLGELTTERRDAISAFFEDVSGDQALLSQITPEAADLLSASLPNRDTVRYGSVVTRARRPGLQGAVAAGWSPHAQASHAVYVACHRMTAAKSAARPLSPDATAALMRRWPELEPTDNDGMVPTMSQPWGEVLAAVDADHLDIIGHFADWESQPPHYDWLRTGTGFTAPEFEAVWASVFAFLRGGPA